MGFCTEAPAAAKPTTMSLIVENQFVIDYMVCFITTRSNY